MHTRTLAVALVALAAACGSSDKVTGNNDGGNITLAHGSMSARISGTVWRANVGLSAVFSNNILAIGGTDHTGQTLGIGVAVLSGPGTYPIGPLSATNATLYTTAGGGWSATLAQGSGSVTVNTLTSTGASGTFSFSLTPANQSASGTRTVTDGVFNVTF